MEIKVEKSLLDKFMSGKKFIPKIMYIPDDMFIDAGLLYFIQSYEKWTKEKNEDER